VGTMHLPTCWLVKPSARLLLAYSPPGRHRAGKDLLCMAVSCQTDPHTSADTANDPALMVIRYLGVGYPGAILPGRRRVPVSLCCDRTTSKMRGLSPKIISGDSRRSENAQTHANKHTIQI
jgi:hypothetical protein